MVGSQLGGHLSGGSHLRGHLSAGSRSYGQLLAGSFYFALDCLTCLLSLTPMHCIRFSMGVR